ncbi:hypothetical protein MTR_6g088615 [Medicago truncatula]|uniref:Uncharacterized protein n=1 Tax=Medicago truncatula TaxID=3880 RepID=A0A072UBJ8_MEDTR|nr:hypothetical protein MTR_6g088615 [Medicago truncatula]
MSVNKLKCLNRVVTCNSKCKANPDWQLPVTEQLAYIWHIHQCLLQDWSSCYTDSNLTKTNICRFRFRDGKKIESKNDGREREDRFEPEDIKMNDDDNSGELSRRRDDGAVELIL